MIAFLLELSVLITVLARHIRRDLQFRAVAFLLVLLLTGGTLLYWQTEDLWLVDSRLFCVMTIATVGYWDVVPTKDVSKLSTIGYSILGIGLFATFVGRWLTLTLEQHAAATSLAGRSETVQNLRTIK